MKICKATDNWQTFEKFQYKPMFINGDKLPYCPICGMSPYDEDYEELHTTLNEVENER